MTGSSDLWQELPGGALTTDLEGRITRVNAALAGWMGRPAEDLIGSPFVSLLDTGSRLFYETRHLPVLRLSGSVGEVVLTLTDGLPVLVNARVVGHQMYVLIVDASQRVGYERDLLAARRTAEVAATRLQILQAAATTFAASLTDTAIAEALVDACREAFAASAVAVHLRRRGALTLVAGEDPLPAEVIEYLYTSTEPVVVSELAGLPPTVVHAMRAARIEALTSVPMLENGAVVGVLICFYGRARARDQAALELQSALVRQAENVLGRIQLATELEHRAFHDELTGLANRALLNEVLEFEVETVRRGGGPLALVFLDLDGFKEINDESGHAAGDVVLRATAERLREAVRASDTIGRFGGDEFVIVLRRTDTAEASEIAERVRAAVARPIEGPDHPYRVQASIGVAVHTADTTAVTADQLVIIADGAMYTSKAAGKDTVTVVRA